MATIGDLVVNLTANTQKLAKGLKGAGRQVAGFASRATAKIATVGAAFAGLAIGKSVRDFAALENLTIQLKVMLGSLEKAESLMSQMRAFGAQTPFQTEEIAKAGKILLASEVPLGSVMETLEMLGDISAATGRPLKDLATTFGGVRATNRLLGQDMREMRTTGIPIVALLAEEFGLAADNSQRVSELVSEGAVTYDRLISAVKRYTSEGGKAYNMTEELSNTLTGRWSTLKDSISLAAAEIGKVIVEQLRLKEAMTEISLFVTETFIPAFKAVAENWDAMWGMMVSGAALRLVQIMEDVKHFGMQVAAVAKFIWESFVDAFETVGDAAGTVFANIKAGNFEDPLEGFQNKLGETALELPDRVTSELEDELQKQFNAAAFQFQEGFAESLAASQVAAGDGAAGAGGGRGGTAQATQQTAQFAEAATEGSQSAFSSILKNVFGKQDKAVDKTAKNTEETVAVLDDILDAMGNRGNSVTVVSSLV